MHATIIKLSSDSLSGVAGQLISIGVLRGLLGRTDQWAWRIPYEHFLYVLYS
jgi:hypothetical protein